MATRLDILEGSLIKKNEVLDRLFDTHFTDVKAANGQPLNDKRNGQATMNKWERQNDAIRSQKESIKKTEVAIEREKSKISGTEIVKREFPNVIVNLIEDGALIQWRKHPRFLFIKGVDKARLVYNPDTGIISHRYSNQVTDEAQRKILIDTWNKVKIINEEVAA